MRPRPRPSSLLGLVFVLFLSLVSGTPQTRYIDDETGDPITGFKPIYQPANQWSQGNKCTGCNIRPNTSLAYNGTWHDTTHFHDQESRSLQLTFNGTALSVFCIIPSKDVAAIIHYELKFYLDGVLQGNGFTLDPSSADYQYNVSVFSADNISNKEHNFTMEASSTTTDSVVLFDYATYVFDDSLPIASDTPNTSSGSSSQRQSSNTGAIAGGVVGGVALAAIIALALLYIRRRRRTSGPTLEPFVAPHDYSRPTADAYVERIPTRVHRGAGSITESRSHTEISSPGASSFATSSNATPDFVPLRYLEEKGPPPAYDSVDPLPTRMTG
ncbi:hypothetical protein V5O48_001556 [Marasmius crinis-equi]|uniref:Uncharacterized protein n=1 Tax=Marasmius crinis-equi TaxID=585013 RepID=A0ABR3FY80_9AGAR